MKNCVSLALAGVTPQADIATGKDDPPYPLENTAIAGPAAIVNRAAHAARWPAVVRRLPAGVAAAAAWPSCDSTSGTGSTAGWRAPRIWISPPTCKARGTYHVVATVVVATVVRDATSVPRAGGCCCSVGKGLDQPSRRRTDDEGGERHVASGAVSPRDGPRT